MASRYDDFAEYRQPNLDLQQDTEEDFFELLSAYIDGEASSVECQQVQQLLDNDPKAKKVYLQLLQLQGEMKNLAIPTTQQISPESLSQQVFAQVERSSRRKKLFLWGTGIVASTIIAAVSGVIPDFNSPSLRLAESNGEDTVSPSVMVSVTLNQPTVTIPKAAISTFPLNVDRDY